MRERPTEARHPQSAGLHAADGPQVLTRILDAQIAALGSIRAALPALEQAAGAVATALGAGRKVAYVGAGSSGLMAMADALELLGTFGIPVAQTPILFAGGAAALLTMTGAVEDDPALATADLARAGLAAGDVALCVSASGGTPYTLEIARQAKHAGVMVIGLANVPGSAITQLADISIVLDTGPEIIAGSTRMGAATAQKAALNMVSVLSAIRLGHVHDGFMVNVVADNAKLRDRAARIVSTLSGATTEVSERALQTTGGSTKTAILVARGRTPDQARHCLDTSAGHLAPWLDV